MKLVEIITPTVRTSRPRVGDLRNAVRRGSQQPKSPIERVGRGSYADAYKHKKRPGTILKVGRYSSSPQSDGYLSYINEIISTNEMATNPYFPRIYDVRVYPTLPDWERPKRDQPAGEYVIEMERLEPTTVLSSAEVSAIGRKIFKSWNEEAMKSHGRTYNDGEDDQQIRLYRARYLAVHMSAAVGKYGPNIHDVHDEKLLEAIELIERVSAKPGMFLDMHEDNIMVRRTSIGPQLVIIDPLADSGALG